MLFWPVWLSCLVENKMISIKKIRQFIIIPSEATWVVLESVSSPNWPSKGNVELNELKVCCQRYNTLLRTIFYLDEDTLYLFSKEKE